MLNAHQISTLHDARTYLCKQNDNVCTDEWADFNTVHILDNDNFWKWPASLGKHQPYFGGLAVHTAHVCSIADSIVHEIENARRDLVFTACLWHDIAKIYDYDIEVDDQGNYSWRESTFRKMERHLVRSYEIGRAHV